MTIEQEPLLVCDDASAQLARPERFTLIDVVNESIRVNETGLRRHRVVVVRHFHALPIIWSERPKVRHILSTIISAADESIGESGRQEAKLTIRVETHEDSARVEIEVDGVGEPRGPLSSEFGSDNYLLDVGHGTPLHAAARLAKELGGNLRAFRAGADGQASFRLELPFHSKGESHE